MRINDPSPIGTVILELSAEEARTLGRVAKRAAVDAHRRLDLEALTDTERRDLIEVVALTTHIAFHLYEETN